MSDTISFRKVIWAPTGKFRYDVLWDGGKIELCLHPDGCWYAEWHNARGDDDRVYLSSVELGIIADKLDELNRAKA